MIQTQKNRLKMYDTVHAFLETNLPVYSNTAEFVANKDAFVTKKDEINLKETERMHAMTGKTLGKTSARNAVVSLTLVIAGALFAYGKKSGDISLVEKTKLTKSKLGKLRDVELMILANSIKDMAAQNSTALVSFGVTDVKLQDFETKIENYSNAIGAKESSSATKSSASKSLKQLFDEADDIVLLMDKLSEAFRESNRQFYNGYKSARVIKDLGVRHTKPEEPGINQPKG